MARQVIELDISVPWDGPDEAPRRSPRALVVAVVVLGLLLSLTGPGLLLPATLTLAWRAPTTARLFWLGTDGVFTVDRVGGPVPGLRLVSRDPRTGGVRWTAVLNGPLAEVYALERGSLASFFPPTFSSAARTYLINTNTGRVSRAYPVPAMPVAYFADDVVVTIDWDQAIAPDPVPDEPHAAAIGLDFSHRATARDLATGRIRWTRPLPAGLRWALPGVPAGAEGIVGLPAGQSWMVTRSTAGSVEVWDLRTGAVLARRDVGRLSSESYVSALGDAVLVRVLDAVGTRMSVLEPATLAPRWTFTPPDLDAEPAACAPVLCLEIRRSVFVVDPATGAILWRTHGTPLRPAIQPGARLATATAEPLTLFDIRTGRTAQGYGSWRIVDNSAYRQDVVVATARPGADADLALLDIGTGTMRRLGTVTPWSPGTRCIAGADRIVCEDDGLVRVWRRRVTPP